MDVDTDVLVVGGGPAGLTIACELARRGIECRVIDESNAPTRSSKAIGLSTRSLEVLHGFDAAEEAVQRGHPLRGANIYSRNRKIGQVTTARLEATRYPHMLALPQHATENVLARRLTRYGVAVEREVRLRALEQPAGEDRVIAQVDGPSGAATIAARWLVGADGAHSAVRHECGIDFAGKETSAVFVITDAELDGGPAKGQAHYYFAEEGLLVVIPLGDDTYRIAATIDHELGPDETDLEHVRHLVNDRVQGKNIEIRRLHDAGWGAAQVRIHKRIARKFRDGRCFLIGDAAHIHSPVGGQGVNLAIQDAHNLAWKLAAAGTGRAADALLDTYHAERCPVARSVAKAVSTQTRLATVRSRIVAGLRDRLIARANRKNLLDRRLAPQLAQVSVDYGNTANSSAGNRSRRGSPAVGKRIPDLWLGAARGASALHDVLDSYAFTLLALLDGRDDVDSITSLRRTARKRYGDMVVLRDVWPPSTSDVDLSAELVDHEGVLRAYLGVRGPTLCLVRPDGHISCHCPLHSTVPMFDHLDGILLGIPEGSESTPPDMTIEG